MLTGEEVEYEATSDITYNNLPLELLNEQFFESLIQFDSPGSKVTDMGVVLKFIDGNLRIQADSKDNKAKGRTHSMQKAGSCAVKSITSWLHGRLGDDYYAFKAFASERAAKELDQSFDLLERLPMKGKWVKILGIRTDHKKFYASMREAAGKILHKRRKKAQKIAEKRLADRKVTVLA